ncbi:TetR/AcrR family transcriptional regulator [Mycolicibacterium parafortuitum]|uniref:TetR family transcriptional regulator [Gordonia sp. KTR9] n=1 Tax=Mycolicibacterium parafortuitum TaxID=39692 RepID=A0A375YEJ8_MYCPF|nr:TetR/AcrR family transcriptional regulator [Mycolicibacterium parafortuitum]ORB30174.1 TetR family transcriptional regulator [Mycolicibacterium parafortuitum]SRX79504.1 TetR family transcriptional regulator [Gordonia sp. KTR9] [Mycolicibacterium parafortuitum]
MVENADSADRADDTVGARILDAALELLRARGPKAVTMHAIVDATGIAKTTIYRRHPNRRSLLAAALETLDDRPSVPADADRAQRLRWVIEQSVDVIARGIGAGGFAALLTDEDPEFSDAFRSILVAYRRHAIDALEVDAATADTVIDVIVGSYVAELARTGAVGDAWVTRLAALLDGILRVSQ